jgi:hypothetical protein
MDNQELTVFLISITVGSSPKITEHDEHTGNNDAK